MITSVRRPIHDKQEYAHAAEQKNALNGHRQEIDHELLKFRGILIDSRDNAPCRAFVEKGQRERKNFIVQRGADVENHGIAEDTRKAFLDNGKRDLSATRRNGDPNEQPQPLRMIERARRRILLEHDVDKKFTYIWNSDPAGRSGDKHKKKKNNTTFIRRDKRHEAKKQSGLACCAAKHGWGHAGITGRFRYGGVSIHIYFLPLNSNIRYRNELHCQSIYFRS
jgi:hypothetical protein